MMADTDVDALPSDASLEPREATLPPESWDEVAKAETPAPDEAEQEAAQEQPETSDDGKTDEPSIREEDEDDVAGKAAAWDRVLDAWSRDPVNTVRRFVEALGEDDKRALLEAIGRHEAIGQNRVETKQDDVVIDEEPASAYEEIVAKRKDWILRGDQVIRAEIKAELDKQMEALAPVFDNIWYLHAQNAALREAVSTFTSDIPEPDIARIVEDVRTGKAKDFTEAVKKHYRPTLEKTAKVRAQAQRPRPQTPRDEGGVQRQLRDGMSMVEIAELLGYTK